MARQIAPLVAGWHVVSSAGLIACTPQSSPRDAVASGAATQPSHDREASSARAPVTTATSSPNAELTSPPATAAASSLGVNARSVPTLPLRLVADATLPGKAARFDYQAVDSARVDPK